METLRMDFVDYQGRHALVTVHYFSGFLPYDILDSKTNKAVTKVLNNISKKFGLVQKINSHSGSCLKFRSFCDHLDIVNITLSSYYIKLILQSKGGWYH